MPAATDAQEASSGLPFRGKLGLNFARQTGQPERWIKQSPYLNGVLDYSSDWGSLYGEGTLSYNAAFEQEGDLEETIDHYEQERILRELYYKKSFGDFTLSLGKMTVVWGKGDLLSVLDVVSPKDQTELFYARPEDTRLGQNLLKLDLWLGAQQLTVLYAPQPVMNRLPLHGHPYARYPDFHEERSDDAEAGLRWNGEFSGTSVALIGGRFHYRDPVLGMAGLQVEGSLPLMDVAGITLAQTMGDVLVKVEAARYHDYPYQYFAIMQIPPNFIVVPAVEMADTSAWMLGLDYNHDDWGSFILEVNGYMPDTEDEDKEVTSTLLAAASWTKNLLRDDLTLSLAHLAFETGGNQLQRLGVDFKITSAFILNTQYTRISIASDDEQYRAIEDFDRFDMGISWNFDLKGEP